MSAINWDRVLDPPENDTWEDLLDRVAEMEDGELMEKARIRCPKTYDKIREELVQAVAEVEAEDAPEPAEDDGE